jgi:hypothetical protein
MRKIVLNMTMTLLPSFKALIRVLLATQRLPG